MATEESPFLHKHYGSLQKPLDVEVHAPPAQGRTEDFWSINRRYLVVGICALLGMAGVLMYSTPAPPVEGVMGATHSSMFCCYYSPQHADPCSGCMSRESPKDWCSASADQCTTCGGTYCPMPPTPSPVASYSPTEQASIPFDIIDDDHLSYSYSSPSRS
eukprot:CAMPEP_0118971886 /NCGR_PEP_ID=MMETSP1173-20130426/8378_1 /TAXON_ID=1034831 /ORGANISM="Rhizochromulina marina cf, Strain CCMP1243" /LENGTH=159 /DNA_ID=CAMNT_0006921385 /DNA_START=39 /DNA_END=518 /DNA_ORIENTATION=+